MRKEKRKNEKFDLSQYDYLDNLDLLGWAWEFVRRSPNVPPEFFYRLTGKDKKTNRPIGANKSYYTYFVKSSSVRKMPCRIRGAIVENDSNSSCIVDGYRIKDTKMVKPPEYRNMYKRLYQWESFKPSSESPVSMIEEEKNPFSVMFLINVAGAETRILDEIKKQIRTWKREFKRLLHMPEQKIRTQWKQCLIVYDLKELHKKDYSEIVAIVYPLEKNDYPDYPITKKVRKNYDRACQLIQGDYKRYIPEIALSAI